MPGQQQGGKGGKKIGRNKAKCERYANEHGKHGKRRITGSKSARQCNPLSYYRRAKDAGEHFFSREDFLSHRARKVRALWRPPVKKPSST